MIILSEDWGAAFADGVETTVENRKTALESFTTAARKEADRDGKILAESTRFVAKESVQRVSL